MRFFNSPSIKKLQKWFAKWDPSVAVITAVIMFCAIIILVVVNIKIMHKSEENPVYQTTTNQIYNMYFDKVPEELRPFDTSTCREQGTGVLVCSSMKVTDICQNIRDYLQSFPINVQELQLININFEANTIKQGWLSCDVITPATLKIDSSLQDIQSGSFEGPFFTNLQTLYLFVKSIDFKRNMFTGISLIDLEITCTGMSNFEENVFAELSKSLQILLIQRCIQQDENVLGNITGASVSLRSLQTLDLQYNQFGILRSSSFQSAKTVRSLYLQSSNIENIEIDAFDGMNFLSLDLSYNGLQTLPQNLLKPNFRGVTIDPGNAWNCNCDLVWLRNLFQSQSDMFTNMLYCYNDGYRVPYTEVNFCNDSTSPTSSPTTTTTLGPETLSIQCQKSVEIELSQDNLEDIIEIKKGNSEIFIYREDGVYTFELRGEVIQGDLIWFNAKNQSDISCVKNVSNFLKVNGERFQENMTYVFCLKESEVEFVSPVDCTAYTIPLKAQRTPEDFTWISKNEMIPFISGICGTLILAILLSGCAVFYCVRQNPSLIKGNKRVILVESKTADAIVMPPYYDKIRYRAPSLNSRSNGYLTPKLHIYAPPRLPTISENVRFSTENEMHERVFKKGHYKKRSKFETFDEDVYEAPPLPPNHPSEIAQII